MTRDDAVGLARAVADQNGWPWRGPAEALRSRKYLLFGPSRWVVRSADDADEGHVDVLIDDATGRVECATLFQPGSAD